MNFKRGNFSPGPSALEIFDWGDQEGIKFELHEHHCYGFLNRTVYESIAADVRRAWAEAGVPTKSSFLRKPWFHRGMELDPAFKKGLERPIEESYRVAKEGFLLITDSKTKENYFLRIKAEIKKEDLEKRNMVLQKEKIVEYQGKQWQVISLWDTPEGRLKAFGANGKIESLVERTR